MECQVLQPLIQGQVDLQTILQHQDVDIQDQPTTLIQASLVGILEAKQIILHLQDMDILDQPPPTIIQVNLVRTLEAKQTILEPVKDPRLTIHTLVGQVLETNKIYHTL